MALDEKRIETRSWPARYVGPVAIHAAKGLAEPVRNEDGLREYIETEPFATALRRHGITTAQQLPRGAVVATANLVACLPTRELRSRMAELPILNDFEPAQYERLFGFYEPGRYAWFFTELNGFTDPIRYRGAQKLWDVPDDLWWASHAPFDQRVGAASSDQPSERKA